MFFTPEGKYDVNKFLTELNAKVDTTKPFALICRTGSRTKLVAAFLANQLHYPVTDLIGGMMIVDAKKLPKDTYK
jgi:rhodanese-related sulfurtransferase